jgi:hypothetical protein
MRLLVIGCWLLAKNGLHRSQQPSPPSSFVILHSSFFIHHFT